MTSGEWHPAAEEYCECILELEESGVPVIRARIAERLRYSRPAVSEMVRRLGHDGLVRLDRHGVIELSAEGRALAERVVRRHRLAERFLTDRLGLSWTVAHREAGKWEHVISDDVEQALWEVLGRPTTCPHGNPIPDSGHHEPPSVPLATIAPGVRFIVVRIPEALEATDGMLERLERGGLLVGATAMLVDIADDGASVVSVGGRHTTIPRAAADRLRIHVCDGAGDRSAERSPHRVRP
jgi:DtxR family Mn-dependent transcriptional regulator